MNILMLSVVQCLSQCLGWRRAVAHHRCWSNEWHVVWCGGNKAWLQGLAKMKENWAEPDSVSLKTHLNGKLLRHTADTCRLRPFISPVQGLTPQQVNEAALIKDMHAPPHEPVLVWRTGSQLEPPLFRILKEIISSNKPNVMGTEAQVWALLSNFRVSLCFSCWTILSSFKSSHFSQPNAADSCGKNHCFH